MILYRNDIFLFNLSNTCEKLEFHIRAVYFQIICYCRTMDRMLYITLYIGYLTAAGGKITNVGITRGLSDQARTRVNCPNVIFLSLNNTLNDVTSQRDACRWSNYYFFNWRTNCKLFLRSWWEMNGRWGRTGAHWICPMRHNILWWKRVHNNNHTYHWQNNLIPIRITVWRERQGLWCL